MAAKKRSKAAKPKASPVATQHDEAGPASGTPAKKKKGRPFPWNTLEEALKVPQVIKEKNNGNPWDTELVAKAALNLKKSNNKVWYLTAASRDYGLTIGTRDTETIELTDLGREIVFAGDEQIRRNGHLKAFESVDIFKRVYAHYGSAKLPEREFLSNTLQGTFGLDPEYHDDFARIFKANCTFLGIEGGMGTPPRRERDDGQAATHSQGGQIKLVGEPKGKFDRTAFVIMPFVEKGEKPRPTGYFMEALKSLITPAGNQAGFAVETAEKSGSDVIQSTIIDQLLKADLVVADLTDHNPNVLFELGIRIAKNLPVALIKAEGTPPVFDVDYMMRVVSYSPNLWASSTPGDIERLKNHFKASWDNRDTGKSYMEILTGGRVDS